MDKKAFCRDNGSDTVNSVPKLKTLSLRASFHATAENFPFPFVGFSAEKLLCIQSLFMPIKRRLRQPRVYFSILLLLFLKA